MTTDNEELDQNNDDSNDVVIESTDTSSATDAEKNAKLMEEMVTKKVAEELKSLKSKVESAYQQRDEALKKVAEQEEREREAVKKRLEEEGKHKELYELQLAEEKATRQALEKKNIELTRDISVRDILKTYEFRNANAQEMAYREVIKEMVQAESGAWVHQSGVGMADYIKSFADAEENSFLFKVKVSAGAGSGQGKTNVTSESKSVFDLSQEEVIKRAEAGTLRQ